MNVRSKPALLVINMPEYHAACSIRDEKPLRDQCVLSGGIPYRKSPYMQAVAVSNEMNTNIKQLESVFTRDYGSVFVANDFVIDRQEGLSVYPHTIKNDHHGYPYHYSFLTDKLFVCGRPTETIFINTCEKIKNTNPDLQIVIITDAISISNRDGQDVAQNIFSRLHDTKEETTNKLFDFNTTEKVITAQVPEGIPQIKEVYERLIKAVSVLEDSILSIGQETKENNSRISTAITELKESFELTSNQNHLKYLKAIQRFDIALKNHADTLKKDPSGCGEKFLRFVGNVMSLLFVIPAIYRVCKSDMRYNTCRFWQREPEQFVTGARNTLASIQKLGLLN